MNLHDRDGFAMEGNFVGNDGFAMELSATAREVITRQWKRVLRTGVINEVKFLLNGMIKNIKKARDSYVKSP
jgi:hypothetical protein